MSHDPFKIHTIRPQTKYVPPPPPPQVSEELALEQIKQLNQVTTSPIPPLKGNYYIFAWCLNFDPLPYFLGIGTTDIKIDKQFIRDLRLSSSVSPQASSTVVTDPIHREQSENGTACFSIFEVIRRLHPDLFEHYCVQANLTWLDCINLYQALLIKIKSLGGCRLMSMPQAIVQLAPLFPYPNPETNFLHYIPNTEVVEPHQFDKYHEEIEDRAYAKYDDLKNRRSQTQTLPRSGPAMKLMSTSDFLELSEEQQDAYLDSLDPADRKRMRDAVRAKCYRDRQSIRQQEFKPKPYDPWGINSTDQS